MIHQIDNEEKTGPCIAFAFLMWHFGDAPVEVEFSGYSNGYARVSFALKFCSTRLISP